MRPYFVKTANRPSGLTAELKYWDQWLRNKGGSQPNDFKNRLDPNFPLADFFCRYIDHLPSKEIKILDVGAGPLTAIGKKHPTKALIISAIDVLAHEYDELLQKYNITPITKTACVEAESLSDVFQENTFDLVVARNSIDHARDPFLAIQQMLFCVKSGCYIAMSHKENEADYQSYRGLHQWNFTVIEDCFIIKSRTDAINVTKELSSLGEVESFIEKHRVLVSIKKR
jgi:hypothetical protein